MQPVQRAILGTVFLAIGYLAAVLTSLAFLPQVLQTWRSRSAGDLSLGTLVAQSSGVSLWIAYGVGIGSAPVIVANAVTLTLMILLLIMKLAFRTR